jgi:hypothetical protein
MTGRTIIAGSEKTFRLSAAIAVAFVMWALPTVTACGGETVSGSYTSSAGREILLQIEVGTPAPATVIIIQGLPPGTEIEESTPELNMYNQERGEAKWLLKGMAPGRHSLSLRLKEPVASGAITGEIRFRDPATGEMVKIRINP